MRLEADAKISYSQLMGIYQSIIEGKRKKKRDLPLSGFEQGKELESSVVTWVKSGKWPEIVDGVFSRQWTHGKNDVARIDLIGPTATVGVEFRAKPDLVFVHKNRVCIVDVKLGSAQVQYLVQAMIISYIYHTRYGINPEYYLLHNGATRLTQLELENINLENAFNLFCLACMAFQNFSLCNTDSIGFGLFETGGGNNEPDWSLVFDGSNRYELIAQSSFNSIMNYL